MQSSKVTAASSRRAAGQHASKPAPASKPNVTHLEQLKIAAASITARGLIDLRTIIDGMLHASGNRFTQPPTSPVQATMALAMQVLELLAPLDETGSIQLGATLRNPRKPQAWAQVKKVISSPGIFVPLINRFPTGLELGRASDEHVQGARTFLAGIAGEASIYPSEPRIVQHLLKWLQAAVRYADFRTGRIPAEAETSTAQTQVVTQMPLVDDCDLHLHAADANQAGEPEESEPVDMLSLSSDDSHQKEASGGEQVDACPESTHMDQAAAAQEHTYIFIIEEFEKENDTGIVDLQEGSGDQAQVPEAANASDSEKVHLQEQELENKKEETFPEVSVDVQSLIVHANQTTGAADEAEVVKQVDHEQKHPGDADQTKSVAQIASDSEVAAVEQQLRKTAVAAQALAEEDALFKAELQGFKAEQAFETGPQSHELALTIAREALTSDLVLQSVDSLSDEHCESKNHGDSHDAFTSLAGELSMCALPDVPCMNDTCVLQVADTAAANDGHASNLGQTRCESSERPRVALSLRAHSEPELHSAFRKDLQAPLAERAWVLRVRSETRFNSTLQQSSEQKNGPMMYDLSKGNASMAVETSNSNLCAQDLSETRQCLDGMTMIPDNHKEDTHVMEEQPCKGQEIDSQSLDLSASAEEHLPDDERQLFDDDNASKIGGRAADQDCHMMEFKASDSAQVAAAQTSLGDDGNLNVSALQNDCLLVEFGEHEDHSSETRVDALESMSVSMGHTHSDDTKVADKLLEGMSCMQEGIEIEGSLMGETELTDDAEQNNDEGISCMQEEVDIEGSLTQKTELTDDAARAGNEVAELYENEPRCSTSWDDASAQQDLSHEFTDSDVKGDVVEAKQGIFCTQDHNKIEEPMEIKDAKVVAEDDFDKEGCGKEHVELLCGGLCQLGEELTQASEQHTLGSDEKNVEMMDDFNAGSLNQAIENTDAKAVAEDLFENEGYGKEHAKLPCDGLCQSEEELTQASEQHTLGSDENVEMMDDFNAGSLNQAMENTDAQAVAEDLFENKGYGKEHAELPCDGLCQSEEELTQASEKYTGASDEKVEIGRLMDEVNDSEDCGAVELGDPDYFFKTSENAGCEHFLLHSGDISLVESAVQDTETTVDFDGRVESIDDSWEQHDADGNEHCLHKSGKDELDIQETFLKSSDQACTPAESQQEVLETVSRMGNLIEEYGCAAQDGNSSGRLTHGNNGNSEDKPDSSAGVTDESNEQQSKHLADNSTDKENAIANTTPTPLRVRRSTSSAPLQTSRPAATVNSTRPRVWLSTTARIAWQVGRVVYIGVPLVIIADELTRRLF